MSTVRRYTAEQISDIADAYDQCAEDYTWSSQIADVLRQAATVATRLQSLEAQNARYKAALERIVSDSEVCPLDAADAETYAAIARNALKED